MLGHESRTQTRLDGFYEWQVYFFGFQNSQA